MTTTTIPRISINAKAMLTALILADGEWAPTSRVITRIGSFADVRLALERLSRLGLVTLGGEDTVAQMATLRVSGGTWTRSASVPVPCATLTEAGLDYVTGPACPPEVWADVRLAEWARSVRHLA